MHMSRMTVKQFREVKQGTPEGKFKSLVILPTGRKCEVTGYRYMEFVAINKNGEPICRTRGNVGMIRITNADSGTEQLPYDNFLWSIDCLPKSGLLRLFLRHGLFMRLQELSNDTFGVSIAKKEKK